MFHDAAAIEFVVAGGAIGQEGRPPRPDDGRHNCCGCLWDDGIIRSPVVALFTPKCPRSRPPVVLVVLPAEQSSLPA